MTVLAYFVELLFTTESRDVHYILQIILVVCILIIWRLSKPKLNLPKGPIGIPLLGNLPFLGKEPHKTLDKLKEKYGSVLSVRLGLRNVIVLADYPAAEDALSKSASLYRPPGMFDFLPDGFGLGGANGSQWVEERRFAIRTMRNLGLGKTRWTTLVEEELSDLLQKIAMLKGQPAEISKLLGLSISNNIVSLIFGDRSPTKPVLDSIDAKSAAASHFFSPTALWIYFPWLCTILSRIKFTSYNKAHKSMLDYHTLVRNEIQNHMKMQNDGKDMDFVTEYLEYLLESKRKGNKTLLNERSMIGASQSLYIGGNDTTRTSLTWLFLIVATFPEVQDKVYAELESVLGKEQLPLWEDHVKFPYTNAVIMEAQRWRTIVPLNTPRMAGEDMKILGYDIPKGSIMIVNIWGLHNDPRYWKNPEEFLPERFLKNEGREVNLKPQSYMPFSLGKRKCPGETVAMMEIFLYFTTVIQKYEIRGPNGRKPNLDGTLGLTYYPFPQDLCFVLRENTSGI